MGPITINRRKGKSKEMRIRDNKQLNKANAKAAGKIKKVLVKDKPGLSKKKIKKLDQRARLLAKSGVASDSMMI